MFMCTNSGRVVGNIGLFFTISLTVNKGTKGTNYLNIFEARPLQHSLGFFIIPLLKILHVQHAFRGLTLLTCNRGGELSSYSTCQKKVPTTAP